MQPKIYISYSWKEDELLIADTIDADWKAVGITLIRDKRDVGYKQSLIEFMRSMSQGDYVLLIIGQGYLQSKNCMFEALELFNDPDFKNKILPIIAPSAKIHSASGKVQYIQYWDDKIAELTTQLKGLSGLANLKGIYEELDHFTRIRNSFDSVISVISDMRTATWPDIKAQGYKEVFEYIGFSRADSDIIKECLRIVNLSDSEEQEIAIDSLLYKNSRHPILLFARVSVAYKAKQYRKAKTYLEQIISDTQEPWLAHYILGVVLGHLGEPAKAREQFKDAIRINPLSPEVHAALATNLVDTLNDYEGAINQLELAVKASPESAALHNDLGVLYMKYTKDKSKAQSQFNQSLEIKPNNAKTHYNIAFLHCQDINSITSEQADEAKDHFLKAINLDPSLAQPHTGLAYLFAQYFKKYDLARYHFEKAIEIEPEDAKTHLNLHTLLTNHSNDKEATRKHAEEALKLDENDLSINRALAAYMLKIKNYDGAVYHYNKLIELDPSESLYHYNLAVLLMGHYKKKDEAKKHYLIACELSPKYKSSSNDVFFGLSNP